MVRKKPAITVNVSPNLNHDLNRLEELYPDTFKPTEICRLALEMAVRDYSSDITLIEGDIKAIEGKIYKIENDIVILEEDKLKLQNELKSLQEYKIELEKAGKGESRKMQFVNAVKRIGKTWKREGKVQDSLLLKLARDTEVEPFYLDKLGFSFYMNRITQEEIEDLYPDIREGISDKEFEAKLQRIMSYHTTN